MIEGIDISRHQAKTSSLAGRAFVICRATYGAHSDDRYFYHAKNVRAAGRVLGAYHFARPISTGDTVGEQVAAFLLMGREADLLFLDLESDGNNGRMTLADARAFISAVHARGRRIGLYMSESAFRDLGQDFDWVANWSREPTRHWDIWQYRGKPLDLDRFDGTVGELRALGINPPDTSTEDIVSTVITVLPWGGRFTVPGGATITGFKLDAPGGETGTRKEFTAPAGGSSADYDATMVTSATTGNPFIRVSTGALAGFYVTGGAVMEVPNLAPEPDCPPCP
jgi:Glycosyl hydrolases family 25